MRRFTTSAGTESLRRRTVLGLLTVEAVAALVLLSRRSAPAVAVPTADRGSAPRPGGQPDQARVLTTRDGRRVHLLALGAGSDLLARIATEIDAAVAVVTGFWGDDWRRDITIITAGTDEEFRVLAGGGPDFAASTTVEHIVFAPGAAAMGPGALRIVLRHELFHYASRLVTAADAPWWLTEGVADYVGRPRTPVPGPQQATQLAVLPTDADFRVTGPALSLAYDRAWWFTRFVAARFGEPTLRQLYLAGCGAGHPDSDTALQRTLGMDRNAMLAEWRQWLTG
ncbi:hypothetical protein ABIA30_004907 [Mycobacterium sp. MAA66]|uniref:peptidase n=1 Tax=Mycobacterium sp. MAA66 TaxID=3156297 RepID=UPI00351589E2